MDKTREKPETDESSSNSIFLNATLITCILVILILLCFVINKLITIVDNSEPETQPSESSLSQVPKSKSMPVVIQMPSLTSSSVASEASLSTKRLLNAPSSDQITYRSSLRTRRGWLSKKIASKSLKLCEYGGSQVVARISAKSLNL